MLLKGNEFRLDRLVVELLQLCDPVPDGLQGVLYPVSNLVWNKFDMRSNSF